MKNWPGFLDRALMGTLLATSGVLVGLEGHKASPLEFGVGVSALVMLAIAYGFFISRAATAENRS